MAKADHISIPLSYITPGLFLNIYPEGNSSVFKIEEEEASRYGEVPYQILESQSYEYAFNKNGYRLGCDNKSIIKQSKREKFSGRINPSYYVGTLKLNITHKKKELKSRHTFLEVKATKFNSDDLDKSYRENYRFMLESITEKCTELLLQVNSPILQHFETDFNKDTESLYQQFSFINSIVGSTEFKEAVQKIISAPKTDWTDNEELVDIRSVKKFTRNSIKQLVNRGNRIPIPSTHSLYERPFKNMPSHIVNNRKVEVIDNSENRFIKHALQTYLDFSENCFNKFESGTRAHKEARNLSTTLELLLNTPFFNQISRPVSLNFNSPVLQRKSGYRELLKSWLKFDLAAKLTWTGGEDVYEAGKRDISKLYEYWLFFMLYDLFKKKFNLSDIEHNGSPYESLIQKNKNGLNFIIKSGTHTALSGVSEFKSRKLNVKFSYNQTFSGNKKHSQKVQGSYTKNMYPDYTLSFWPAAVSESKAEEEELIVHIHFDAKYKVNYTGAIQESRNEEEEAERKGNYKNVDLFKMHAYKDAIRRTGGAYILYPGNSEKDIKRGFHEIIPGLGAFALRPSAINNGSKELDNFIDQIINHLLNRASQRENLFSKTYEITKDGNSNYLHEALPENFNKKKLIPDDTYVLLGYAKNKFRKERMDWFLENGMYNFRMNEDDGALEFTERELRAKFLIIRESFNGMETKLYQLKKGIKVFTGSYLESIGHPDAKKPSYLVVEFDTLKPGEFEGLKFNYGDSKDYKELKKKYGDNKNKLARPFTTSLTQLLKKKY